MLGWRKRKEGFEWHEYVRTTILVRRRNRRERIANAGRAAVDGLKAAGGRGAAAGAAGAEALGRGAKAAGRRGVALGAAGLRAAAMRLRAGLPVLWELAQALWSRLLVALAAALLALAALARRLAELSAPALIAGAERLEPLFAWVRKPGVSAVLALVAGVAFVGSARRVAANGFSGDILVALLIGSLLAGALIAAWLSEERPSWLGAALRGVGRAAARLGGALGQRAPSAATIARGASLAALLALVVGLGWVAWRAASALPTLASLTGASTTLEGRAIALSGDTLRIGTATVVLAGIEAPLDGQTCRTVRGRRWRCDRAARAALARLADGRTLSCEVSSADAPAKASATCRLGDKDISAELVRGGFVFAEPGLLAAYAALEREARAEKLGIWNGEAERPADYRTQKWQEATRSAPDGCPIKGNVRGGRRIYLLPWSRDYARVRVSRARGERWFCSEDEARAAGWAPSERS